MRILMVCLGNICRSPMAEGLMRRKLLEANLTGKVDSAGTANFHIGKSPDYRMVQTGKIQGTPINDLKARQFSTQDFEDFDLIYAMDKANYKELISNARHERDKQKVLLILNEISPNEDLDVPDPYYDGMDAFKEVYELLDRATEAIKNKILDDKNR